MTQSKPEAAPIQSEKITSVSELMNTQKAQHHRRRNGLPTDVTDKPMACRIATAETYVRMCVCAYVRMQPETLQMIHSGEHPKGSVFTVAKLAGTQAVLRTHSLMLADVAIYLWTCGVGSVRIEATCRVTGPIGVEMEALTAVTAAALTIYDMCKDVDRSMTMEGVRLLEKAGSTSRRFAMA